LSKEKDMSTTKDIRNQRGFMKDAIAPFADYPVEVTHDRQYWVVVTTIRGDQRLTFTFPDDQYTPAEIVRLTRGRLLALKTVD
jgi:hypothetical protein